MDKQNCAVFSVFQSSKSNHCQQQIIATNTRQQQFTPAANTMDKLLMSYIS